MADYFSFQRKRGNSVNRDRLNAPLPPNAPPTPGGPRTPGPPGSRGTALTGTLESLRPASNIRIRRLPSGLTTPRPPSQEGSQLGPVATHTGVTGRRRSSSEPQRYGATLEPPGANLARQRTTEESHMASLAEEDTLGAGQRQPSESSQSFHEAAETPPLSEIDDGASQPASRVLTGASAMHDAGNAARSKRGLERFQTATSTRTRNEMPTQDEYHSDVVDLLDLVDPEVRTIGTLTNVQNSLFVPNLGGLINRRPTYNLTQRTSTSTGADLTGRRRAGTGAAKPPSDLPTIAQEPTEGELKTEAIELQRPSGGRRLSISSNLSDSRYAVLPHGISLDDWTEDEKAELDDHVRHLMHSKREGFKRGWKGFIQYISKPLGLFVFVYATLVTLFGAAWVFFLIGWIYVGHRQKYIINIVDNILVALFALMGDGLAPFRAVDTYHMCFIARYHHLTWRLRKEKDLPELLDHNDLPLRRQSAADIEDAIDKEETTEFSVLKPIQQRRLQYHQAKFSNAHTFYRPHETATHHAFPLNLLVAVVVLLDFHSLFQITLGTVTWSWNYHSRPSALTATILSLSISCNITAGIIISVGDHRTRKKDVFERLQRQELTQEAISRMAKKRHSDERIARKSLEVRRLAEEQQKEGETQPLADAAGPSLIVQAPTRDDPAKKTE